MVTPPELNVGMAPEHMLIGLRDKHFEDDMATGATPHFQNEMGLPAIEVGAKEFMCIGALPPFDHPHIFIDMGTETGTVCPYCSTLYKFNPRLGPGESIPARAAWTGKAA
jgi:uncharacterized Zn-finger protein